MSPLDEVLLRGGHVVPQVVEAELAVRSVGNVGPVGGEPLLLVHVGVDNPHRETEEGVDGAHPFRVPPGEVVVHRHHVDAFAGKGVQHHGKGGHQRLAFAGLHLRDFSLVEGHSAHELDIEVAKPDGPLRDLPHDGEHLGKKIVGGFPVLKAPSELRPPAPEFLVRQGRRFRLEAVDLLRLFPVAFQRPVVGIEAQGFLQFIEHDVTSKERSAVVRDSFPRRFPPGHYMLWECMGSKYFGGKGKAGVQSVKSFFPLTR